MNGADIEAAIAWHEADRRQAEAPTDPEAIAAAQLARLLFERFPDEAESVWRTPSSFRRD